MATKISKATIFVVLAATLLQTTFAATYTVGDSTGWIMPTNNDDLYDNWNDNKVFVVGDVLVFNFTTGQHNVAEVTEAAYDSCTTTNPISTQNNGPVGITLNRTGEHYFICTFPGHCSAGQKLNVEVRNGNSTIAPSPAPGSSPNTRTAVYTVGDSTGWTMPTNNDDLYDNWNDNKVFMVGDVLVFNFTTGQHNVAEVTEADYDACTATNPISTQNNGPARVTLNRTGEHYFICTFPGHCSAGQKLNVEVRNGNSTIAPSPAPGSSPNTRTAVYTVGDSTGWTRPTNNDDLYDNWADNKVFVIGDVLVFNFTTGQHNVAEVTEADYDDCTATNPISTQNNGPARITLNRTGEHYFICTLPGHCSAGQKLNIEVRNGNRNALTPGSSPNSPNGVLTPNSASSLAATFSFLLMSTVLVFLSY
ncbi:hypothetical protein DITRI_Ditri03aG0082000 [Diplodiscus trichospermus]